MKNNQPVTETEIHFSEHDIILSTTDSKGVITSTSPAFCKISGFSEAEMIGRSHNLVRHPDMPAEVFEWMWRRIKTGRAWRGLIKNRSKSGDYYWVNATVLPIYERGRIEGYRSLRTKPNRIEVAEAAAVYAALKARQIKNPFVEKPCHRLFCRFTFRQQMMALLLLAVIAAAGPTWLLTERLNDELNFSIKEVQGIGYIRESIKLIELIQQHRGFSMLALAGNSSVADQWQDTRQELARQVEKIDKINSRLLSLGMSSYWSSIRSDWQKLAADAEGLDMTASIIGHCALIDKVLAFNRKFGDSSNLALDPEISTYYLINVANGQLPELAERMSLLSTIATRVLHRKNALPEEAEEISHLLKTLQGVQVILAENIDKLTAIDAALRQGLQREIQSIPAFIADTRKILLNPGKGEVYAQGFLESAFARTNKLFLLTEAADNQLNRLLDARIERISRIRLLIMGGEICLFALFFGLCRFILCAVLRPVSVMSHMLGKLGAGKMPLIDNNDYGLEFTQLKEVLNQAVTSVHTVIADLNVLSEMLSAGKLDFRPDANMHQGEYAEIIAGINAALDSLVKPSGKAGDALPVPETEADRN